MKQPENLPTTRLSSDRSAFAATEPRKKLASAEPKPTPAPRWRLVISRWVVVCLVVGALLLAGTIIKPYFQRYWYVERDNQYLEAVNAAQTAHSAQVSSIVAAIQTPTGIADRARDEYDWVLPGETAVNVVGAVTASSESGLPATLDTKDIALPGNWLTDIVDQLLGYQIGASGITLP